MTCETVQVTFTPHFEEPDDAEDMRELAEEAVDEAGSEEGTGCPFKQNHVPLGQQYGIAGLVQVGGTPGHRTELAELERTLDRAEERDVDD